MEIYTGFDLGASSLKVTLCDAEGKFVATNSSRLSTYHPMFGYAEQRPADWIRALQRAWAGLHVDTTAIRGIAVSAGAHSFVLLDTHGKPLGNALMWSDQRAKKVAGRLSFDKGESIRNIGKNHVQATWTLAMLAWLKEHQPEILAQAKYLCFAKDYLRQWLCDGMQQEKLLTDPSDAVGSLLVDVEKMQWSGQLCQLAGITVGQMPSISASTDLAGRLGKKAASKLAMLPGVAIYTGCIDTTSELLPANLLKAGSCLLKLASAGVWSRVTNIPTTHAHASLYPAIGGKWYHASGTNNCAAAIRWGSRMLWNKDNPRLLDAAIAREYTKPLSHVMSLPLFHPYLLGERAPLWNADLRANLGQLDLCHGRDEVAYAIAEGVIHALVHARDICGLSDKGEAVIVTGGLANLPHLMQLAANLLNQPLQALRHSDASYGSALLAGLAASALSLDDIDCISTHNLAESYQPQPNQVQYLADRHVRYLDQLTQLPSYVE